jgi:hypothetical protein
MHTDCTNIPVIARIRAFASPAQAVLGTCVEREIASQLHSLPVSTGRVGEWGVGGWVRGALGMGIVSSVAKLPRFLLKYLAMANENNHFRRHVGMLKAVQIFEKMRQLFSPERLATLIAVGGGVERDTSAWECVCWVCDGECWYHIEIQ